MSLLPLEFRSIPLDHFANNVRNIPFLDLGLYSRADWVANGVVFAPIGFLWCAALTSSRVHGLAALALCVLATSAGAWLLEATQLFFVGRTESLNDIYAEMIGGAVGALAWLVLGQPLRQVLRAFFESGAAALRAGIILYLVAVVAVALFPFDFLLSLSEFRTRLEQNPIGVFPSGCAGVRCLIDVAIDVVSFAPLGVLIYSLGRRWLSALAAGLALGIFLEFVQLFTFSGTVELSSFVLRSAGAVLGWFAAALAVQIGWARLSGYLPVVAILVVLPYLGMLMVGNQWRLASPLSWAEILDRANALTWIPFAYFYVAAEATAVQKLVVQIAMYAPVGVLYWALFRERPGALARAWIPAVIATGLAAVMGLGRLALYPGVGPDPTNLLIAALVAFAALKACCLLAHRATTQPSPISGRVVPLPVSATVSIWQRLIAAALAVATIVGCAAYPFDAAGALTFALIAYAIANYARPRLWLFVVPLAIPALDRALVTGTLIADELTLLLAATLVANLWRTPFPTFRAFGGGRFLLGAFVVSSAAAAIYGIGLLPDEQWSSLALHDGPRNPLRRLLTVLAPLALIPYLVATLRTDNKALDSLRNGMLVGLVFTALALAWERYHFPGLFDLEAAYRAAGPFTNMNTGGAALDGYLITAMCFGTLGLTARSLTVRILSVIALGAGFYAVSVTFTRATYVAVMVALFLLFLLRSRRGGWGMRIGASLAILTLIGGLVAMVANPGGYMRSRVAVSFEDFEHRVAKLQAATALAGGGSIALGTGLGTFPWVNTANLPPEERPGRAFPQVLKPPFYLTLIGGDAIYFDQAIDIDPTVAYTVRARVRSEKPTHLRIHLCEKHIMSSADCVSLKAPSSGNGRWETVEFNVPARRIGVPRAGLGLQPPVVFTLQPPPVGNTLDVTGLAVEDPNGRNLLRNGGFSNGGQGWFFTQDNHVLWHLKNVWGLMYFEQGLFGLFTFGLLTLYIGLRAARGIGAARGIDRASAGSLAPEIPLGTPSTATEAPRSDMLGAFPAGAAFVGIHLLAMTDGVLDAPRFALTVWLVYGACLAYSERLRGPTRDAHLATNGSMSRPRIADHAGPNEAHGPDRYDRG